jgi:hypothetical protein
MCLSKVYLNGQEGEKLFADEVSQVQNYGREVRVSVLAGGVRSLKDYFIAEVNLMDNYILLKKKKENS